MLNDYLDFIVPDNNQDLAITDAPSIYHEAVFYSIVGTLLGRRRYFPFGDQNIYPNLWLCILGETSKFRKSTALAIGLRLLRDVKSSAVYPNEFSHEKLVEIMQQNPIGTFCFFELRSLIDALEKDYLSSTRAFLTEMFDCPEYYRRQTKGKDDGDLIIEKPAISILGASTVSWMRISDTNLHGGFLTRFLFVNAMNKEFTRDIPTKADSALRAKVLYPLKDLAVNAETIEYKLSSHAKELYIKQCRRIEEIMDNPKNERITSLFGRQNVYIIKIAMIIQTLLDAKTKEIGVPAMSKAVNFVDKCVNSITMVLGDIPQTKDENDYRKLHLLLKRLKVATRTELLRASHFNSKKFNDAISTLKDREELIEEISTENADKPTTIYKIKK